MCKRQDRMGEDTTIGIAHLLKTNTLCPMLLGPKYQGPRNYFSKIKEIFTSHSEKLAHI